ncbi:SDR family NAD(P)-dependent oxidoreductase [Marinobacterium mangrovicola]|uniref:NAD(P)-dependent dehydrogenase (Short-subunit alcohol dehydrogenase family) n=1 Tax=Marinobacterium mangrovicola TaxID=1476959 RepID=A0A4R1GCE0_9GAMM|nr:glucose 1-dehydrogenase [Marinobacterium mangrovicola]TCK04245.1 NAD(P)-dependent dehydrogenase (short-subunit alcohol dehydrogenase family) [Marinobacterium mangrovicola]
MSHDFTGKVALVTGGASGMGLATVKAFAKAGAAVAIADINGEAAQAVADELAATGAKTLAITCDVTDEAAVKAMVEKTVETFGSLDAAFNNAGVQSLATETADLERTEFDRVVNINLGGVWNCMKHELVQMRKQGSGAIVNCSSLGGFVGVPGRAAYHAAKHGVHGLTKTAALEYAAQGIRINAVCPGITDTPMVADMKENETAAMDLLMEQVPARRLGTAEEVADPVLWLCGPGSTFVMGHALAVDGGYTVR